MEYPYIAIIDSPSSIFIFIALHLRLLFVLLQFVLLEQLLHSVANSQGCTVHWRLYCGLKLGCTGQLSFPPFSLLHHCTASYCSTGRLRRTGCRCIFIFILPDHHDNHPNHQSSINAQAAITHHPSISPITRHSSPITRPSLVIHHPSPVTRHPSPITIHHHHHHSEKASATDDRR